MEYIKIYLSIVEASFPVKLPCNDCIIKSAIQIILNLIELRIKKKNTFYIQLF